MLNGYITPVLRPLGFTKTGNTYRRTRGQRRYEREHRAQPGPKDGLYRDRLRPPQDTKEDPVLQTEERWYFNDRDSANNVGAHIAELLGKDVAPRLVRLLDRERFLSYVKESEENMPWPSEATPRSLVLLLIDKGPSPDLSAALQQAEQIGDHTVIKSAQAYLNRQDPQTQGSPAS